MGGKVQKSKKAMFSVNKNQENTFFQHYPISPKVRPKEVHKNMSRFMPKFNPRSIPRSMSAEKFNKYFCNVAPEIDKNFTGDALPVWASGTNQNKFTFTLFSSEQVKKELVSLNQQANLDILGIDRKLLQLSADFIHTSLTVIFNESISKQNVHNDFKKARVTNFQKRT